MRVRLLGAAVISVLLAGWLIAAALPPLDQAFATGCDNEAGECLRMRQQLANGLVGAACASVDLASLWNAIAFARRPDAEGWRYALLGLSVVLVVALVVVDPASHLDNRFTGWLSD